MFVTFVVKGFVKVETLRNICGFMERSHLKLCIKITKENQLQILVGSTQESII